MLFIDKYSVKTIDDVKFNHASYKLIGSLTNNSCIPHMIISADSGVGKKSLINYYIQQKFGLNELITNPKLMKIKCSSSKEIEFSFLYSNYHYLIEPSKYGVYDKQIIQFVLNEILKYRPINKTDHHLIVVNNADRLTIEAQQSLRRTLEKFVHNCRFIFLVNCNSSMIEPIRSRCFLVKLNCPTQDQIRGILNHVIEKENISISNDSLTYLINYAGNLKESLHLLQLLSTFKINLNDLKTLTKHLLQDDNCYVIARMLLENAGREINISDLILDIRKLSQELLIECISPIQIIKRIFGFLFDYTSNLNNDELTIELVKSANYYINGLKVCNKPIYYIEAFCMTVYQFLDHRVIASRIESNKLITTPASTKPPKLPNTNTGAAAAAATSNNIVAAVKNVADNKQVSIPTTVIKKTKPTTDDTGINQSKPQKPILKVIAKSKIKTDSLEPKIDIVEPKVDIVQ